MSTSKDRDPFPPGPGEDEVHVWKADLALPSLEVARLAGLLDEAEARRASRFRFERDRAAFTAARAILRTLVGRYLGRRAEDVRFSYGSEGKPSLAGDPVSLTFNLSHSSGVALFAFARRRAVGIDIERVRDQPDLGELAERFFSPAEVAVFQGLPPAARMTAFFLCWTRKEAYIKARGGGLSIPLDTFSVSFGSGDPPALLESSLDPDEPSRWSFRDLGSDTQYAAAIAVEVERGRDWRLLRRDWMAPTVGMR